MPSEAEFAMHGAKDQCDSVTTTGAKTLSTPFPGSGAIYKGAASLK